MNGRMGRLDYFVKGLMLVVAMAMAQTAMILLSSPPTAKLVAGVGLVLSLAAVVVSIALTTKRLHDIDRSGWHVFLMAVPFYNFYLSLLLLFGKGTDGANRYGADPLALIH